MCTINWSISDKKVHYPAFGAFTDNLHPARIRWSKNWSSVSNAQVKSTKSTSSTYTTSTVQLGRSEQRLPIKWQRPPHHKQPIPNLKQKAARSIFKNRNGDRNQISCRVKDVRRVVEPPNLARFVTAMAAGRSPVLTAPRPYAIDDSWQPAEKKTKPCLWRIKTHVCLVCGSWGPRRECWCA